MSFVLNINVCRVCMKNEEYVCADICDPATWHKFEYTTHLTISPNDQLPKTICCKCELHLKLAYKFIKLAQQSEINLRKFLSKVNNVFDEIAEPDENVELAKNDDDVDDAYDEEFILSSNNDSDSGDAVEAEEYKKQDAEITQVEDEQQMLEIVEDLHDDVYSRDVAGCDISYQIREIDNSINAVDGSPFNNELEDANGGYQNQTKKENDPEKSYTDCLKSYENNLRDHDYNLVYIDKESSCYERSNSLMTSNEVAQTSVEQLLSQNSTNKTHHKLNTSTTNFTLPYKQNAVQKSGDVEEKLRFYCAECNRDFSTKTNLNRHMMSHRGNKPYVCKQCYKGFSQSGSLKQHMYTHTGERPYKCDFCRRAFTQRKSLIFHRRRHTGEKPFQCDSCDILFRQKDALKMHMLRHHIKEENDSNGEKFYSCNICKKFFQTNFDVQYHMQLHTNKPEQTELISKINLPIADAGDDSITDDVSLPEIDGANGDQLESNSGDNFLNPDFNLPDVNITLASCMVDVSTCSTAVASRAKKFKCGKCFKSFAIKMNLQRHLALHNIKANMKSENKETLSNVQN